MAVQWLRILPANAGDIGLTLGLEDPTGLGGAIKPVHHNH